jgi:glycosyltransferase involved in cell wall biosynthesis
MTKRDRHLDDRKIAGSMRPVRMVHVATVPASLWYFLDGQVRYLTSRGFEVTAVAAPGPYLERFGEREGARVHAVDLQRRITPLRDVLVLARVARFFRRSRPDIVQSGTPKGGLIGMVAAWIARVPVRIYQMHGLPMMTASGYRRVVLWWSERASCVLAHRVFCVSPSLRELAIAEGLCSAEKAMVIGPGSVNGVDATGVFNPENVDDSEVRSIREQFGITDDAVVIGFVGRVVRDKGLEELARAWEMIRDAQPQARLLIIGHPYPDANQVPAATMDRLRRDPHVHFAGTVRGVAPWYRAMDVLVLPTWREGFGSVLLEAAAMGIPVVATRVTGCVDAVVDGETGTLVAPRDAHALAAAMSAYLEDPNLRRRHGAAGRARALSCFRQETLWRAYLEEYRRLLAAQGIPAPDQVGSTEVGY